MVAAGTSVAATVMRARTPVPRDPSEPPRCQGNDSIGLRLTFFDVGQGAATLLATPEGRRILIDGGQDRSHVTDLLRARGIPSLDLVIATHNHADHIGGLPLVLDSLPVANFIDNGLPATTSIYQALVRALSRADVRVLAPTARTLTVGTVEVRVLPADQSARTQNEQSVGAVISYGEFRTIFSGDAEVRSLQSWLDAGLIPHATVAMVGHHGSADATTPAWVRATSPELAVISVGGSNSYGHPAPATLAMWSAARRRILRTDSDGTIEVRGCHDGSFTASTSGRTLR